MDKPLLYFKNQRDNPIKYKSVRRFPGETPEDDEKEKNYSPMQDDFRGSLNHLIVNKKNRERKRNKEINIFKIIDFIEVTFFDYFKSTPFDNIYRRVFGLSPVLYRNFNKTVIFAIINEDRFKYFIGEIEKFIKSENPQTDISINKKIYFIESFKFYTSGMRRNYLNEKKIFEISFFDNAELSSDFTSPNIVYLKSYLETKKINYSENIKTRTIILYEPDCTILSEIEDNFDIVMKINSVDAGIIRPSEVNLPIREFGFEVTPVDNLPIIAVIDTGVSNNNPLRNIILDNVNYNITDTNPLIDNVNHGTAVACFAALGKKILPDYKGNYEADSRILSIKILDNRPNLLSPLKVVDLIKKANKELNIKIFTLTICNEVYKKNNEIVSEYAYALDLLAYELNILIFISVGNYVDISNNPIKEYPNYYISEETNLSSPSESMNNITVGSISDNLEYANDISRFAYLKEYPSPFSRKFNIGFLDNRIKKTIKNKLLNKPDFLYLGGDFENIFGEISDKYALKLLSAKSGYFFDKQVGTSYSTGLAANLAAKILKKYPQINENMQTVKALILNSCYFPKNYSSLKRLFHNGVLMRSIVGYGIPNQDYVNKCDEDTVTFILEDEITLGSITTYPIKLPNYLNSLNYQRNLLEIKATLCFSFKPVKNNQLAYCPIHITFGFFKNLPIENDNDKERQINNNASKNIKIKSPSTWSQDYYYSGKFLSNTQKLSHRFNKNEVINEQNEFKIAVASKIHKLLSKEEVRAYETPHKFSLVVTIKELPNENKMTTGRLFDEMKLINNLEALGEIEVEAELNED